jgi:arabinan endo-1,5-alpha-L-arabinosidase
LRVYEGYFADPFVLRLEDGTYAAYGTGGIIDGRAFEVLRSDDLERWERVGGALEPLDEPWATDYWAPEVAFHEGTYFMYYSPGTGDAGHLIRVATSDSPWGPFVDAGRILTPNERFAIDAHPFRDDDGQWYLYYAHDALDSDRRGTTVGVDRLVDMTTVAGEPRTLLRASHDWQLFERGRTRYAVTGDWYTLEGPFVRRRGDRYFLFYSGGNWQTGGYGVSYAVADDPLGPFTEPEVGPVVVSGGAGHNSIVVGPDGEDRIVYHRWDDGRERREMWIERLVWEPRPRAAPA